MSSILPESPAQSATPEDVAALVTAFDRTVGNPEVPGKGFISRYEFLAIGGLKKIEASQYMMQPRHFTIQVESERPDIGSEAYDQKFFIITEDKDSAFEVMLNSVTRPEAPGVMGLPEIMEADALNTLVGNNYQKISREQCHWLTTIIDSTFVTDFS